MIFPMGAAMAAGWLLLERTIPGSDEGSFRFDLMMGTMEDRGLGLCGHGRAVVIVIKQEFCATTSSLEAA
jgi:hypothetical protein